MCVHCRFWLLQWTYNCNVLVCFLSLCRNKSHIIILCIFTCSFGACSGGWTCGGYFLPTVVCCRHSHYCHCDDKEVQRSVSTCDHHSMPCACTHQTCRFKQLVYHPLLALHVLDDQILYYNFYAHLCNPISISFQLSVVKEFLLLPSQAKCSHSQALHMGMPSLKTNA